MNAPDSNRPAPPTAGPSVPPAPLGAGEVQLAAVRLRAEVDLARDSLRRARLLYEIGELEEAAGRHAEATAAYFAAHDAEPEFHEALEGLARTLRHERSPEALGKLFDALTAAATTPDERARAWTARGAYLYGAGEFDGARAALQEAIEAGAGPADAGPAHLLLEAVAARLPDPELRETALTARAALPGQSDWRALLLIDAANLAAGAGALDRAVIALERARDLGGSATYLATRRLAELLAAPTNDDAEHAARAAGALEGEAALVVEAMSSPARASELGVPTSVGLHVAVERLVRAARFAVSASDPLRAAASLDRAITLLEGLEGPSGGLSCTRRLLLATKLQLADSVGDDALASAIAAEWLPREEDGRLAASLAMTVAEEAAGRGDLAAALEAASAATRLDPECIPARALELDLLADGEDAGPLVERLASLADAVPTLPAKGRGALLVAFLAGSRLGDSSKVRDALGAAASTGVDPETIARLARSLALLMANTELYESASRDLLGCLGPTAEALVVGFEIVRERVRAGDAEGARAAREALVALPGGAELAQRIAAFVPGQASPDQRFAAIVALDRGAPTVEGRTLGVLHALAARDRGDAAAAVARAQALAAAAPDDPFLAFLALDLARETTPLLDTALRLEQSAPSQQEPEIGAAMLLEAAFIRFRAGRPTDALRALGAARELAPEAAQVAYAWALRGQSLEQAHDRRDALAEASQRLGEAEWALERFANGVALEDDAEVRSSLEAAGRADGALPLAAALGVLASASPDSDAQRIDEALDLVANLGKEGAMFAAGERTRLARDRSDEALVDAASAWFGAGGGLCAAVEWLSASMALGGGAGEVLARDAVADALQDEAREGVSASARLLGHVLDPSTPQPLVAGTSHAVRLANLELAPPGSDPRRRAAALNRLGSSLGDEMDADAAGLSAWSIYLTGDPKGALPLFRAATAAHPSDLASWEGVRTCALELGDHAGYAEACEQLGARARNSSRGAVFWEQAGLTWLDENQGARAEAALDQSFHRDPTRPVAFDKLFRRVRDRKESDKMLELVDRRLPHTDDTDELVRLYWEQSRALREKGDFDGALYALENVRTIDPDHVGALALLGEVHIRRGRYDEAAAQLARLASVPAAPAKSRVTAGIAAVDLYENKLGRNEDALRVLQVLHAAGISTLPVRERLARAAARTGAWEPAATILEELMGERDTREGRVEAARLALVIYRDRIRAPARGLRAVTRLLDESPTDGEGLEFLVEHDIDRDARRALLERGQAALLAALQQEPGDPANGRRLSRVARALGSGQLEHVALSVAIATNGPDPGLEQALAQLASGKPRAPQLAMTEVLLRRVLAPGDEGPHAQLFALLGPTIAEALGPTVATLGVTKRERVDPRSGVAVRNEIAAWAGAFGIADFELYIGGKDPQGVQGVPGEPPALVVGGGVTAPLTPLVRSRVARELLGISRGTVITRWRDDTALAALVVAACNLAKVQIDSPPYAILAEVERSLGKALGRRTRNAIEPVCRALAQSGVDTKTWVSRAIASQHRMSAIASGDVSVVLADAFGLTPTDLVRVAREDLRCAELFRFALTPDYFDIRRLLGLETSS